jgi:hypothetical protein
LSPTRRYEDKVLLLLTLIIGAVVGLVVVAFILVTENLGSRLYPGSVAPWRRLVVPVAGALLTGILLARYFPNARGSGIPQTKTALFVRDGFIAMRTVIGKFSMSSGSLRRCIAEFAASPNSGKSRGYIRLQVKSPAWNAGVMPNCSLALSGPAVPHCANDDCNSAFTSSLQ